MINQVGKGLFVLNGEIVDYLDQIEKTFYKIGKFFEAEKLWIPSHLSLDNVEKTGYIDGFENQASMIHSVHGDSLGMCSPTACHHCYCMLSDKKLDGNKCYTATGKCTRIEDEGDSLERLFNFTMSEIIFVGTESYCVEALSDALCYAKQYFDGIGLKYKFEIASDPFFGSKAELKKRAQHMSGAKIEILAEIPNENRYISIGSVNLHQRKFVDNFNIGGAKCTACFAWGLERIVHVLMLQKENKPLFELKWDSFVNNDKRIKKDLRMNTIKNIDGWYYIDGELYWIMERDLTDIKKGNKNNNFVVVDSFNQVEKYKEELIRGIENMHKDLYNWEEKWDFTELERRIARGCILYVNIINDKAVQWQWIWVGSFVIRDHKWNLKVDLEDDIAFTGHWWVDPKHRFKRGLFHSFYQDQWFDLKSRGFTKDVSYSDGWNRNAVSTCQKLSYVGSNWIEK
jgi:hypothetical protein